MMRAGNANGHWSARTEAGAEAGLNFLYAVYRWLGRWPFYAFLLPVTLFYFALYGERRRASLDYLRRLHQAGRLPQVPGLWLNFRHFWEFSCSVLDKLAAWHGGLDYDATPEQGQSATAALLDQGKGFVVLMAHLGNLEAARFLSRRRPGLRVSVLMHTKQAQNFNRLMHRLNPDSQLDIVQVSEIGPDTAILLREKVAAGSVVIITADRSVSGAGRNCLAPFLGAEAPFPQGPFVLASLLECPVFLLFCLKVEGTLQLFYEPFADRVTLPRGSREKAIQGYASRFAARLEHYCGLAPLQWQNFYPFWVAT